jgi:hypothetical protein
MRVLVVGLLFLAACGSSQPPPAVVRHRAVQDCSTRSEASFPGAYKNRRNLVVGPLALIGGRTYTTARTVREVGGQKFPLLVKPGHRVTIQVARGRLAYGEHHRDARRVTFVACRHGGPTFWSGFVLTAAPACIPLSFSVDGASAPRRARLELGRRC